MILRTHKVKLTLNFDRESGRSFRRTRRFLKDFASGFSLRFAILGEVIDAQNGQVCTIYVVTSAVRKVPL